MKDNSLEKYYEKLAKDEEKKNRQLPEFKKKYLHVIGNILFINLS